MTTKYEYERVFHGILIKYDKCSHCGQAPTSEQIEAAIALSMSYMETLCRICGITSKITAMVLYHAKDEGIDRWGSNGHEVEPMVTLMGRGGPVGYDNINVHLDCLKKAMPYIALNKGTA